MSIRGHRQVPDINNLFIEVYRAFPAAVMGRGDIDATNNIILPSSALGKLSIMKDFGNNKSPFFSVY